MIQEELEIKDVMIGDWVDVRNNAAPNTPHLERITPSHFLRDEHWYGVELVPEILEKNGIKYQWGMPWYQGGFDGVFELHYNNSQDIAFGDTPTEIQIPISYVHQLQHALRLCGIDNEITL